MNEKFNLTMDAFGTGNGEYYNIFYYSINHENPGPILLNR